MAEISEEQQLPPRSGLEELWKTTLDQIENILDDLTAEQHEVLYKEEVQLVEEILDNTAASLVSWSLNVRLETMPADLANSYAENQQLRQTFGTIVDCAKNLKSEFSADQHALHESQINAALQTLTSLSMTLRARSAMENSTGPLKPLHDLLSQLGSKYDVAVPIRSVTARDTVLVKGNVRNLPSPKPDAPVLRSNDETAIDLPDQEPAFDEMPSTYDIADYKVGIICALPKERTAVEAMLDEIHDIRMETPGDSNVYTFGSFAKPGVVKHNVVVASLGAGSYGVVSAAQVAGDLRRSFPHLKYSLMVGIAGAMTRPGSKEADIRLGDIVVGCANGVPSVVDYTRGKETSSGFDVRSELADPPEALSRAVSALMSLHQRLGPTYLMHLANMLKKHKQYNQPRWQDSYYNLPDAADILFESQPDACVGDGDCGNCLIAGHTVVSRKPRDLPHPPDELMPEKFVRTGDDGLVNYPLVFLGSIGSAHKLMKSSVRRDEVSQMVVQQRKAKLLCFDMEASGIVKDWPCLVIRGICDYADSHKNDDWQNFAAATAAAYTKDLLLRISSADVDGARPINGSSQREQRPVNIKPSSRPSSDLFHSLDIGVHH